MAELFTAYGKAAMYAACLENSLILLIALARSSPLCDGFSFEHNKLKQKTLGALINEAKKSSIFSSESNKNLDLILKYRNWMVHDIARDALGFILQKDGNAILANTLCELSEFFHETSEMVYAKIAELCELRGINQADIDNLVKSVFEAQIEPDKSDNQNASKTDSFV
ncbi:hypothetical protein ACGMNB_02565 [Shewanella oncorhynchi]|uniref:hypothetical protein n=1 Tax=Shewanella TaxID=22 RepID=UPI001B3F30A0|nr:hypothetical protein [Shewanella sp.]